VGTGFYHSFNVLKYRILHVLVQANQPLTTLEIAQKIGIDRKRVTDAFYHWHRCNYGYVSRLRVKKGKYYLYKVAKHGIEAYVSYDARFKKGLSLNRKTSSPKKMHSTLDYFGINEKGKELGISISDIPELAGLKKRNQSEPDIDKQN
jgi:AraC-like DNA-binding protein